MSSSPPSAPTTVSPETVPWSWLAATPSSAEGASLAAALSAAYGFDGLGILAVRGVPGLSEARAACLPYARAFAAQPAEVKAACESPDTFWSFGWSHGKERLAGAPDINKGSYYFNPISDEPCSAAEAAAHPSFAHPNVWPPAGVLPGMAAAAQAAARLAVAAGLRLAVHADAHVAAANPAYAAAGCTLAGFVATARCHKARLLWYFPLPMEGGEVGGGGAAGGANGGGEGETHCAWHNDHGSLTALLPAMFFAEPSGEALAGAPDAVAGLYVRTRRGTTVRVALPADCLAFQIGETAQVHSGGVLQATPHCVRAPATRGVGRATLAVFMEPEWDAPMRAPPGADADAVLRGARGELLPPGVPPLVQRWRDGDDFGAFTERTLKAYH